MSERSHISYRLGLGIPAPALWKAFTYAKFTTWSTEHHHQSGAGSISVIPGSMWTIPEFSLRVLQVQRTYYPILPLSVASFDTGLIPKQPFQVCLKYINCCASGSCYDRFTLKRSLFSAEPLLYEPCLLMLPIDMKVSYYPPIILFYPKTSVRIGFCGPTSLPSVSYLSFPLIKARRLHPADTYQDDR